jgi:hypothetical protein
VKARIFSIAGIVFVLVAGCRTGDPKKEKSQWDGYFDGGIPELPEECIITGNNCFQDCYHRKASRTCVGCCRDQDFLCVTKQPHSYESCRSAH